MTAWLSRFGKKILDSKVSTSICAVFAFFAVLLIAAEVLARAGGGGNYSSGGGGGFSGGGGEGGAIIWLLYLAIRYPQVGVPALIVVGVVGYLKYRYNPDNTTKRAVKKLEDMGSANPGGIINIESRDPAFNTESFLNWVRKVDNEVQEAWSRAEMSLVRNYLSDGIYRRFATQLAIMKEQGIQNPVADHTIFRCVIHSVEQDEHFDTIHVAIEASARDIEVDASLSFEDAMAKAQKQKSEPYTEIWSFLRKPGVNTLNDKGFQSGTCPNCGAPLENAQTTKCEYCNAIVNSGDYDWVLAEITQPIEWKPASTGNVEGISELSLEEPAFNRQVAEDKASYVFWRWIEAQVTHNKASLAKCATSAIQADVSQGAPKMHFKTAVGAVDLIKTASSQNQEDNRMRYWVKILWSSASSQKAMPVHKSHVFVFSKEKASKNQTGLSSAHCPNCLGPLAENDSQACEYCGANLSSGDVDWVLERVMSPYEMSSSASSVYTVSPVASSEDVHIPVYAMPDMASRQERAILLMNMAAIVMADGIITKAERKLLKAASKRWSVPMEMINPILYGQVDSESVKDLQPSSPMAFMDGLIGAALIDGKIDSKEQKLLLDVAKNLNLEESTVKNRMNTLAKTFNVSQMG